MQSEFSAVPPYPPQQNEQIVLIGDEQAQQTRTQWNPATAQKYEGDIPDDDMDEDACTEPVAGSFPPPTFDVTLPGYEGMEFGKMAPIGLPPTYGFAVGESAIIDTSNMDLITKKEAKHAMEDYVAEHCCYGKEAADDMDIEDIKSSSAFRYILESFTESRSTEWRYAPYSGGFVDGPNMGPAPGPWDIPCSFSNLFQDEEKRLEVPHTTIIRPCNVCCERGFLRCWRCCGRGMVRCAICRGVGKNETMVEGGEMEWVACMSCEGIGRKSCYVCSGVGCTTCLICDGFGQIKQYAELIVTFKNRLSEHIVEHTDMPDHLISDASGDIILEQILPQVGPIVNFFEQEINQKSEVIVKEHSVSWPYDKIIQQRQTLSSVPVFECKFEFKDKDGRFWVYGKQRSVYTEDYPQTCFCCSIL